MRPPRRRVTRLYTMCRPRPVPPLAAPGREERVEGAPLHLLAHAEAVVAEQDLDMVGAARARVKADRAGRAVRERMRHGVQDQIGQNLAVGPGIAVHRRSRRDSRRPAGSASVFRAGRRLATICSVDSREVERAPLGVAAVDRDLLERLDQVGGAVEVGDELLGGVLLPATNSSSRERRIGPVATSRRELRRSAAPGSTRRSG